MRKQQRSPLTPSKPKPIATPRPPWKWRIERGAEKAKAAGRTPAQVRPLTMPAASQAMALGDPGCAARVAELAARIGEEWNAATRPRR